MPLNPMGVWSDGEALHIDWLQPWKGKDLTRRQKDILYTVLKFRFMIRDYFEAKFRYINLRAPEGSRTRELNVELEESFKILDVEELEGELSKLSVALRRYDELPKASKKEKPKKRDDEPELPFEK